MEIFCTYCSKDKNETEGKISAISRYKSDRIQKVYESAKLLELPFYIFSGKYGLISPDEKIPFYDHLLVPEEIKNMVSILKNQMKKNGISHIVFFTNSILSDPYVKPYLDAINLASESSGGKILIIETILKD